MHILVDTWYALSLICEVSFCNELQCIQRLMASKRTKNQLTGECSVLNDIHYTTPLKFRELCKIWTGKKCKIQKTETSTLKWCLPDMASSLQSWSHCRCNCNFLGWACSLQPWIEDGFTRLDASLRLTPTGGSYYFQLCTHLWTNPAPMCSFKPQLILV